VESANRDPNEGFFPQFTPEAFADAGRLVEEKMKLMVLLNNRIRRPISRVLA
jgi:hypothetical protein